MTMSGLLRSLMWVPAHTGVLANKKIGQPKQLWRKRMWIKKTFYSLRLREMSCMEDRFGSVAATTRGGKGRKRAIYSHWIVWIIHSPREIGHTLLNSTLFVTGKHQKRLCLDCQEHVFLDTRLGCGRWWMLAGWNSCPCDGCGSVIWRTPADGSSELMTRKERLCLYISEAHLCPEAGNAVRNKMLPLEGCFSLDWHGGPAVRAKEKTTCGKGRLLPSINHHDVVVDACGLMIPPHLLS